MAERLPNDRFERRFVDWMFYILLIVVVVLAGWLGARHDRYWDLTQSSRNTLGAEGAALLASLEGPLRIKVFVDRHHPLGKEIARRLAPYRNAKPDLQVDFVDPQLFPEQARTAQIDQIGQMLFEYRGRRETVSGLDEDTLSAAMTRLRQEEETWIAVLEGHGERRLEGTAPRDIGRLANLLRGRGFRLQPLDLTRAPAVPDNIELLVVSAPDIALFDGEAQQLIDYLERGGKLLWLMEPGDLGGLEPVLGYLGVEALPGQLVDANVRELNIQDPTVAMVADYPSHPLTRALSAHTLFPGSLAFAETAAADWTAATPLKTRKYSWNETGPIRGDVMREQELDEMPGPLPLALALTRPLPQGIGEQRVLLVGDGDFLSNAHLDNAGNRALALHLVNWLTTTGQGGGQPSALTDVELGLTRTQILVIGGGSLFVLPLLFLATGLLIRWQRRRG